MSEREAFEKWISQPPYEKDVTKYPDDPAFAAWPKCYRDIAVQLAWDAWQAANADAVPDANLMAAAHESFQSSFLRNDHVEKAVRSIAKARDNNQTLSTTADQ
jgi:hypothetical protein